MALPRNVEQIDPRSIPVELFARPPSGNKHGGNQSWINLGKSGMTPVVFQTPSIDSPDCCETPFGISPLYVAPGAAPDPNKSKDRLNCEVTVKSNYLKEYLEALDEWVLDTITVKNYQAWFGSGKKPPTPELLRQLYRPCLSDVAYPKKDGKEDTSQPPYDRTFRVKFNMTANGTKCFVGTKNLDGSMSMRQVSPVEAQEKYAKFARVTLVVKVSCIYYQQGGASGVTFEALQALFMPAETVTEYAFNLPGVKISQAAPLSVPRSVLPSVLPSAEPVPVASASLASALARADERSRQQNGFDDDDDQMSGSIVLPAGFQYAGPQVNDLERA